MNFVHFYLLYNSSLPSKNIISTRDLYIDISLRRICVYRQYKPLYSPIPLRLHSLNLLKSSVVQFNRSRGLKVHQCLPSRLYKLHLTISPFCPLRGDIMRFARRTIFYSVSDFRRPEGHNVVPGIE